MRKFIIINSELTENLGIYDDLKSVNNVIMHTAKIKKSNNYIIKSLKRIHLNNKINKIINLPHKDFWYEFNENEINSDDEIIIITTAEVLFTYDFDFFNQLNAKPNVHLVLFLIDSMNIKTPKRYMILDNLNKVNWDYIFSYDKEDAINYNYLYLNEMYYSIQNDFDNFTKITNDIYYLARLKPGREKIIMNVYKKFKENNVNANFDIWLRKEDIERCKNLQLENGINYFNQQKDYKEILDEVKKTNCILEILQEGQTTSTLRYFEAVVYNKKLLTNNENIKNLNFYDERYMRVFKDENDIDMEWVKEKVNVDYHYNNEFSPINIVNKLNELYNDKKKE